MSELAIQTVDLLRRYGKYTAVNKLNLKITLGSIFGFLGPNGAGKSSFAENFLIDIGHHNLVKLNADERTI